MCKAQVATWWQTMSGTAPWPNAERFEVGGSCFCHLCKCELGHVTSPLRALVYLSEKKGRDKNSTCLAGLYGS